MARYRHKKNGRVYETVTDAASLCCSADPNFERAFADDYWTVYRDEQIGTWYVRPTEEFLDGRFEELQQVEA